MPHNIFVKVLQFKIDDSKLHIGDKKQNANKAEKKNWSYKSEIKK